MGQENKWVTGQGMLKSIKCNRIDNQLYRD